MTKNFPPQRWLSAAALTLAAVMVCAGCTIPTAAERGNSLGAGAGEGSGNNAHSVTPSSPAGDGTAADGGTDTMVGATISAKQREALRKSWMSFRAKHPGVMSVAILPVGATPGTKPIVLGKPASVVAGETLRAPIAVAAARFLRIDPVLANNVVASLNSHDAEAAEQVWLALGGGREAAQKALKVLRLAGDTHTQINPTRREQATYWSLPAQVQFAAGLACMSDAGFVRDSLQPGLPEMNYGFANDSFNRVLSGWTVRPSSAQHTVVGRQFAIVDRGSAGFVAVSVSVQAPDGSRKSAEQLLTAVAQWLQHSKAVPTGRCL